MAQQDLTHLILEGDKPTNLLYDILRATHITDAKTLSSIVQATQKSWLRPQGIERCEMDYTQEDSNKLLMTLLNELKFNAAIVPFKKQYDHVLVLGDTLTGMRVRFAYALNLWKNGVTFNTLTFLTGQRPRFKDHLNAHDRESNLELYDRTNPYLPIDKDWQKPSIDPETETDIARMIVEQTEWPASLQQHVPILILDTPLQHTPHGLQRPNTGDTFKLWLKEYTSQGSVLAISSQPYVGYQHAVLKAYAPQELSIETVGPKPFEKLHAHLLLDTLARWLYQEDIFQKKLHVKM